MNEVKMNDRLKNDCEVKTVSKARKPTRAGAKKTEEERIVQRENYSIYTANGSIARSDVHMP